MIGERYLWIDTLCIVQNDSAEKKIMIEAMDRIYSGALLTIMAASVTDAYTGLPGLFPGMRSSLATVEGFLIKDTQIDVVRELSHTKWSSRG